jgi:hypothetical protein
MDFPPSRQQSLAPLDDDLHGAPNVASLHAIDPCQRRDALGSDQIDLRLSVAEDMDMSQLMVVHEGDEAQAMSAMGGDRQNL